MAVIRDAKTGRFKRVTVPTPSQVFKPKPPPVPVQRDRRANGYKGPLTRAELSADAVPTPAQLRTRHGS